MSPYWIKITSFLKPPSTPQVIVDSCYVLNSWLPAHQHLIGVPACVLFLELCPSAGSSLHTQLYSCLLSSVLVPSPFNITLYPGTSLLCNFYGFPGTRGRTSQISESSLEGTLSFVPHGPFLIASPISYLVHPLGPEDTRLCLLAGGP